ncbi:MAG TPA: hypothetical protein GX693_00245 [Firmicutes bacterium]|nr:hypothetical protein [Bacillota bacterium]
MLKRCMAVLLGVVLLLSLTGCGVKKKVEEKVTEKITEGIIDKVAGEDVDIDLDDGKINIKDKDGTEWSIGGGEWPKGEAASLIPEFKKGKIESVIETTEGCMIFVVEVDQKDYEKYIDQLTSAGYTEDVVNYSDSDALMYSARFEEKAIVSAAYGGGEMTITVEIQE